MNDPHDLDALARQKLEQRAFPFDEADWADAERMIKESKSGRSRRGLWFLAATALLLLSVGTVWFMQDEQEANNTTSATANSTAVSPIAPSAPSAEVAEEEHAASNAQVESVQPVAPNIEEKIEPAQAPPSDVASNVKPEGTKTHVQKDPRTASAPSNKPSAPKTTVPAVEVAAVINTPTPASSVPAKEDEEVAKAIIEWANTATLAEDASAAELQELEQARPADESAPTAPVEEPAKNMLEVISPVTKTDGAEITGTENTTIEAPPAIETKEAAPSVTTSSEEANSTPQAPAQDSAVSIPGTIMPLLPAVAHTEFSLLGGLFTSTAKYSGGHSEAWNSDVRSVTKPSFGLELAHMNKNFGYGGGLHYAEYAEQLQVEEKSSFEEIYTVHYHLMPVDTMVTIVVDTIYDQGVAYYVTQQVGTTINVLESETDTARIEHQERAARELVNSVRYIEVPLFADAHVTCGRWTLGVRGGPSIGFLSGRRGALPNDTFDGYTDMGDQPFSTVVFGYNARAYVRYRVGMAWAIGVEPAMRGQLTNAFGDADLSRRASAFGGFVSLTYRLPVSGR